MIIYTQIRGIPCQIEVLSFSKVPPDPGTWDDELGRDHIDFDYQVLGRNGRRSPWLESIMTDDDRDRIRRALIAWLDGRLAHQAGGFF